MLLPLLLSIAHAQTPADGLGTAEDPAPATVSATAAPAGPATPSEALPKPRPPRRPTGLLIAGAAVLSAGYTPPFLTAVVFNASASGSGGDPFESALGFVPVAGPFIWEARDVSGLAGSGVGWIVVMDGIVQASGAGLIIAGLASHRELAWVPAVRVVGDGIQLGASGRF